MCCCDHPNVNGEPGYKWQPNQTPTTRKPDAPELQEGDVLLYDEPGRCGGLDHHAHHFRVVKAYSSLFLLVRHGGGDERIRMFPHNGLVKTFDALDSTARYWILSTLHAAHRDGAEAARTAEAATWRKAAAEGRLKTKKQRGRDAVKVWIEPALFAVHG
jgi:hypothetical protein